MFSFPRRSIVISLSLGAALVAASCGVSRDVDETAFTTTTLPAAPVEAGEVAATLTFADGTEAEIATEEVESVRSDLNGSQPFKELVFPPDGVGEFGTADVLNQMIGRELLVYTAEASGGEIDDEARDQGEAAFLEQLESQFIEADDPSAEAAAVADSLGEYRDVAVDVQAAIIVIEENAEGVPAPCVSHILVEDEAQAEELIAELEEGADFAELAAEYSTDPGSGAQGGVLGCQPTDAWVPEFKEAVDNATEGEIVGPVESQFGFHIIVVTGEEVDSSSAVDAAIGVTIETVTVDVDPAIGVWANGQIIPAE